MGSKTPKKQMNAGQWMTPVSSTAPSPNITASQMPATTPASVPASVPVLSQTAGDPFTMAVVTMNTNPYLIGIFMLLLNLGGRFLSLELTKKQEAVLQAPWVRPLIFFTVIFMATRNVVVAFWLTVIFFFFIWVVANENSPYCMIPSWCGHDLDKQKETYMKNVDKLQS